MSDVTRILEAVQQGDPAAAKDLLPLVYEELRRLARSKMAQQAGGHTLQPTVPRRPKRCGTSWWTAPGGSAAPNTAADKSGNTPLTRDREILSSCSDMTVSSGKKRNLW